VTADARTDAVRRFYEEAPFPGYPPNEDFAALRARGARSAFARLLDRAIAPDARVVEIGCGTGQMCLYLARAGRLIVGADLTRASLTLGADAVRRYAVKRLHFVETDLNHAGLKAGSFDVVYTSGVLHHTPDPRESFAAVAELARPGGIIVVGVYNAVARIPSRLRRLIARLTSFRFVPFDPVLRDRRADRARREAWLRDQYRHPEEHRHTIREVQSWFREQDVEYLRTFPSTVFGEEPADLFAPAADDWAVEAWLAQLGWMWTLGHEGGLFFTIGQRR
jgi:SAM-dependent methyltransferase